MNQTRAAEIEIRLKYVGQPLKRWREEAGLSQSSVAKSLNYASPQFVSNWERGLALPPLDVLPKLVELYQIAPDELVDIISEYQEQLLAHEQAQLISLLLDK